MEPTELPTSEPASSWGSRPVRSTTIGFTIIGAILGLAVVGGAMVIGNPIQQSVSGTDNGCGPAAPLRIVGWCLLTASIPMLGGLVAYLIRAAVPNRQRIANRSGVIVGAVGLIVTLPVVGFVWFLALWSGCNTGLA